jgi:hypothetical protein
MGLSRTNAAVSRHDFVSQVTPEKDGIKRQPAEPSALQPRRIRNEVLMSMTEHHPIGLMDRVLADLHVPAKIVDPAKADRDSRRKRHANFDVLLH